MMRPPVPPSPITKLLDIKGLSRQYTPFCQAVVGQNRRPESPETFACRIRVARCGVDYAVGGGSPGIVANFPAGPAIEVGGETPVASAEEEVGGDRGERT